MSVIFGIDEDYPLSLSSSNANLSMSHRHNGLTSLLDGFLPSGLDQGSSVGIMIILLGRVLNEKISDLTVSG